MAWYNTNYQNRKKVTLAAAAGAGTNYQVLLKIGASTSASGYDLHLAGHSQSFPTGKGVGGDLAITASDETTLLDFWVEKITGSGASAVAYVWVEVAADLSTTNQVVCVYYNNSASPSNLSNGGNTFALFDDFPGSSLDTTTNWNALEQQNSCTLAVASSAARFTPGNTTGSGGKIKSKISLALRGWAIHVRGAWHYAATTTAQDFITFGFQDTTVGVINYGQANKKNVSFMLPMAAPGAAPNYRRADIEVASGTTDYEVSTNNIASIAEDTMTDIVGKLDYANAVGKLSVSGSEYTSSAFDAAVLSSITDMRPYIGGGQWSGSNSFYSDYDFVFVRKYQATEPAFSSVATEENASTTYTKSLIYTAAGTVALGNKATLLKAIVATATGTPKIVRAFAKSLLATAVGSPILGRPALHLKALAVTATGVVNLAKGFVYQKAMQAYATGSASLIAQKVKIVTMAATALANTSIARQYAYTKSLAATAVAAPSVTRVLSLTKRMTAVAVAQTSIGTMKAISVTLQAVATAMPSVAKALSLSMALRAIGNAITSISQDYGYLDKYPEQGIEDDYQDKYPQP